MILSLDMPFNKNFYQAFLLYKAGDSVSVHKFTLCMTSCVGDVS